jgi:hypothetical protein
MTVEIMSIGFNLNPYQAQDASQLATPPMELRR